MSDQGAEGQVPEPPGLEGRGEMPPRPTVRESFRRGLFVRLPTEGDAEGLAESEQGEGIADQYPEQVADPYPGWRQAADGSWEAVSPEAIAYVESTEAAPAAYPEIDQSANYASVAGGEPFIHEEAAADAPAWTFAPEQDFSQVAEEAPLPEVPQEPEFASEPAPEVAPEVAPDAAPESVPEPVAEEAPVAEAAPSEQAPEAAPEISSEAPAEAVVEPEPVAEVAPTEPAPEPVAEAAAVPETAPEAAPQAASEAASADDAVAGTGLYIPSDVELLEGDMPVYGENENVPPRFAGSGLGEPFFIEFADLARTLTGLRRLLPKGTRLTYNYDYERAWVRTSADIDLASFAERIEAPAAEGENAPS
ncbi:MAG: hypothetical protein WBQ14_06920 [Gaiellaceae bacterium]